VLVLNVKEGQQVEIVDAEGRELRIQWKRPRATRPGNRELRADLVFDGDRRDFVVRRLDPIPADSLKPTVEQLESR
jgi:hypothetical protein